MKKPAPRKTYIAIIILTVLVTVALVFDGSFNTRSSSISEVHEGSISAFYDGATIKWIVAYNPGGGYDEYVRLMAPYLEKYTGARVQVRNIPGAGGLRGFSELFRSPADGLTIGLINGSGLITSQIAGISGEDLQINELSFLGRVVKDTRILAMSGQSKYSSFIDVLNAQEEVRLGATGLGGSTYMDAVIMRELFELNVKVIHGFDNSSSVLHAIVAGNLDGTWSSWGSAQDATTMGRIKIVLQGGRTRAPSLPDIPTVFEFVEKTADPSQAETILSAWEMMNNVGRPVVAPPGLRPDKREYLREAIRLALQDPQFLDDVAKAGRFTAYASGEEMEGIVNNAVQISTDMQQLFTKAMRTGLQ